MQMHNSNLLLNKPWLFDNLVKTKQNCDFAMFKINEITYISLTDGNRYIIISENSLELTVLCKTHETLIIQQPQLLSCSEDCTIFTQTTTFKILPSIHEYSYQLLCWNYTLKYDPAVVCSKYFNAIPLQYANTSLSSLDMYKINLHHLDRTTAKIEQYMNQND